jgi:CheY-like chemotaxis protein
MNPARATGRSTILIVDDEPDLLATCSRLLRRHGYRCLTASSGREAIDLIGAEHPDLVVTDLAMPVADGLLVTRHARRHVPPVPVVLMTAYGSRDAEWDAWAAGAAAFVRKPFTLEELRGAIEAVLAAPSDRGCTVPGKTG